MEKMAKITIRRRKKWKIKNNLKKIVYFTIINMFPTV